MGEFVMAEHQHGSMDIKTQEKTFEGFIQWMIRGAIISSSVLVFLAVFNS
jgi:hypothetical protein